MPRTLTTFILLGLSASITGGSFCSHDYVSPRGPLEVDSVTDDLGNGADSNIDVTHEFRLDRNSPFFERFKADEGTRATLDSVTFDFMWTGWGVDCVVVEAVVSNVGTSPLSIDVPGIRLRRGYEMATKDRPVLFFFAPEAGTKQLFWEDVPLREWREKRGHDDDPSLQRISNFSYTAEMKHEGFERVSVPAGDKVLIGIAFRREPPQKCCLILPLIIENAPHDLSVGLTKR